MTGEYGNYGSIHWVGGGASGYGTQRMHTQVQTVTGTNTYICKYVNPARSTRADKCNRKTKNTAEQKIQNNLPNLTGAL